MSQFRKWKIAGEKFERWDLHETAKVVKEWKEDERVILLKSSGVGSRLQ